MPKDETVDVVPSVAKSDAALREEAMQQFWEEHDIFNKSLTTPAGAAPVDDYVFYDGPPFATGLPHYGHLLAGTIKDTVPRFWTMRGYRVRRQWGWDCHGLPLENLIEKKLGLATKRDIEEYGVQNFNEAARAAVLEYADDWKQIIPRFGRFVDMDNDYRTMDSDYTESVWWVFKTLHEKGLVYEGFKGMHLCPRCGTTLSNFEVNQGYKDIKDIAVTVKLPLLDEAGKVTDTSLLVWTTTPWTLPGNLAAAVHQDYTYTTVRVSSEERPDGELLLLAKERLVQLGDVSYEVVEEMPGSDLVGRRYQPPFPVLQDQVSDEERSQAWRIYHADYVELGEEGTGAVHLAPAYGEEDMELAKEHGIPIVHHVDTDGHFKAFVTDFAGQLVKPKDDDEAGVSHLDADIEVVKKLKADGTLFKKENITHSYPHCWRCDTPLLNYATTSWFVEVSQFRDDLVAANRTVHWVPEHVGTNRFGKWLEGARDWAVSRQRYWGAPLPVWKNPETDSHIVIGSLKELQQYVPRSGNQYLLMRHGESESNVAGVVSAKKENPDPLTDHGVEQVTEAARDITDSVDLIIHSGFVRTKQTAELVAETLGLSPEQVIADERMAELDIGSIYDGKSWSEYETEFTSFADRYTVRPTGGIENRRDVQVRTGDFLFELEQTYQGKTILVIAHGGSLFGLQSAARGLTPAEAEQFKANGSSRYFDNAEVKPLTFVRYPHNDNYELDFHRPYIDQVDLYEDGVKLERVADVFDCWFESGAMPYAQHHYPFGETDTFETELFSANFIAESIDQTRGWFYSLMVLGVALFGKSPYQNVVTNGLVLAEDGKKMSKSQQNYPDPVELVDEVGADAVRFYMLSSGIMRGEDLNFSKKEVMELQRKNIGRLHNVLALYELYATAETAALDSSTTALDRWIYARLAELVQETTAGYESYELDKAARPLTHFIDDLSVWYVRRSRERLKSDDADDAAVALGTLRHVLQQLALVMAPAMPFYAEYLWQRVRDASAAESVHLAAWPETEAPDSQILEEMTAVRSIVSAALELRTEAGIRVRQPLASLTLARTDELDAELAAIVADEVNVKTVQYDAAQDAMVKLDTELTPELRAEGAVRELMRAVQSERKRQGLNPHDLVTVSVDQATADLLAPYRELIQKTVGASGIETTDTMPTESVVSVEAGEYSITFVVVPD